jgi:putative peptidoglycan lipid II flippase
MAVFLMWASTAVPWLALRSHIFQRIGLLALVITASAAIYFVACWAAGLKLRALLHK